MTTTNPGSVGTAAPSPIVNPSSNNAAGAATLEVSRRTLETIPERTLALLRAIACESAIRATMNLNGYSDEEQQEGWRRLHAASGFQVPLTPTVDISDAAVRSAINEIDSSDEKLFRITAATLNRRFPEQAAFVLGGIGASRGINSVLNVEILLDRLDTLATGTGRESTRERDQAAVATLAGRGLSAPDRARLRMLIQTAKRSNPVNFIPSEREEFDKNYLSRLAELRDWYMEWSEIARAVITRRDYLIRMGLANMKRASAEPEPEVGAPVETGATD